MLIPTLAILGRALVTVAAASSSPASLSPCATAPPGMTCVAGGAVTVGSDDAPNEKPQRSVQLSTFYVDTHEATNAEYAACAKVGACPKRNRTGAAGDAATGLDYHRALRFCTWAGKRLPTEWEWEKAARTVKLDTAGRREWTSSWLGITGKRKAPVDAAATGDADVLPAKKRPAYVGIPRTSKDPCQDCDGVDPRGPCDGAMPCVDGGDAKIVRGGKSVSWRRGEPLTAATPKLAVRCVSSSPVLTRFPAKIATEKRATPPAPTPPTAEQLKTFADVKEDPLDTQVCAKKGRSFLDCRDPKSYIKSNEPRQQVWRPYIENLGGGYTGVGIDQNYTFIAAAHSQWAWLFDYDPTVVRLHWILRAVILHADNRGSFVDAFRPKNAASTLAVLDEEYRGNAELPAYREIYKVSRAALLKYYARQLVGEGGDATFGWLSTDDNYGYIRTMYQQGRIRAFKGNMLGDNTMQGIAAAAKKMGVTIRVYYPSNAPECWPFTRSYKNNVIALPFDDHSVVLQTVSGLAPGYVKKTGHWHYNVQSALLQQDLMRRKGTVLAKQLIEVRNKTQDPDLTISGLAGD